MSEPAFESTEVSRALLAYVRAEFLAPIASLAGLIDILAEDAAEAGLSHYDADLDRMRRSASALHDLVSTLLGSREEDDAAPARSSLRHDLRTPITAVIGYGELVAEEARERGDAALFTPLADVLDAAGRLLHDLDKLVAVSDTVATGIAPEGAGRGAVPEVLRHAAEVAQGLSRREAATVETPTGRILVVDDNASMRDLISRRLERDGHRVQVAGSGRTALRMAAGGTFDLMLLDLMMPGMNGLEVLDRLRASPEGQPLPVIVISALDEVETAVRCIEAGADDFLAKPLNETLLRARIGSSLERKFLRDREQDALARLRQEQERSETLLHNVLPADVVERLRQGEDLVADHFDQVTVLFCDLVGFTALATALAAPELLDLLNEIFSGFDALAEEYGLEKVKTVGDAYMVVGGRSGHQPDHPARVARMALRMPAVAACVRPDHALEVRIGIDTGPAVGGIIGRRKFFYDVWGDTVNFASRLEATAEPGRIHVSSAVNEALAGEIACEPRPPMDIKGKGPVQTYYIRSST